MKFDIVIIGGGRAGMTAALKLQQAGRRCAVVTEGASLAALPFRDFADAGGTILPGDSVVSGYMEGNRLVSVTTRNLGRTSLEAGVFLLCTGKFFSKGLVSTMDSIYEPVFGCDVIYEKDRSKWVDPDFFAPQPFEQFGVATDEYGRVSISGNTVENLYAAGEILAGCPDIEGSAEKIAETILKES